MEQFDVVVVGAGLAGLTAAAQAAGQGARVALVEAHRPGGRAATTEHGGIRFNQGPHAVYRGGPGMAVLDRLGIRPTGGQPASAQAHGWRDGALHPLPKGIASLARTPLLRGRERVHVARLLGRLPHLRAADGTGRSAAEWFAEHDLEGGALDLVTMLARTATYVAEVDRMPASVALAQMQLALGAGVLYLHGGWQQLVDGLVVAAKERGAETIAADPVVAVASSPGGWVVSTAAGRQLAAPAVVRAAGSPAASAALLGTAPWGETGPDVTAACLDVAAAVPATPPVVFGVGSPLYLSTHCPPAELAPPGTNVVAVMRYRAVDENGTIERDREELRGLRRQVGIGDADVVHERYLHRMTVVHGLPDPLLGLPSRPPVAVAPADGLFLAGDWVGPSGWLADASLASGEAAGLLAASCAALVRPG